MEGFWVYSFASRAVVCAIKAVYHRLKKENDVATYELVWSLLFFIAFTNYKL